MTEDDQGGPARSAMTARRHELSRRLDRWDPIGVYGLGEPWPPGEYECLVDPIMRALREGADPADIAAMLARELVDHFGLPPAAPPQALAAELRVWWDAGTQGHDGSGPGGGTP